jgi:hypothetical protein
MDWSVYVETVGPPEARPLDAERLDNFGEVLGDLHASVSASVAAGQRPAWSAQLTIEDANQPTQAAERALLAVCDAAREVGLPAWPVVKLEVTEWERFDAELDEPNTPDLVGVAELAELCGVTRQRASVLARSGGFPKPLAELASGPVWDLRMVERFVRDWARKPGRPATRREPPTTAGRAAS